MEACGAPVRLGDSIVSGDGREPLLRPLGQAVDVETMCVAIVQRPEQKEKLGGGGLQQGREIEIEGAKAHAVFAQLAPVGLVE